MQKSLSEIWTAKIITLFPEAFPGALGLSLTGQALKSRLWQLSTINLRDFGLTKHRNVDDTPTGGGAGMVMRPDVLEAALHRAKSGTSNNREDWPILALSPRGIPFSQTIARKLAKTKGLILIAGRFEGIDQRFLDHHDILEISIGDYVLTGGDIAAQVLIDAVIRLKDGVLGNPQSTEDESHSHGLLEYPQYTKPNDWLDHMVPEVLLSGHHRNIAEWRQSQSERLTKERRPDLWRAYCEANNRDPKEDQEL